VAQTTKESSVIFSLTVAYTVTRRWTLCPDLSTLLVGAQVTNTTILVAIIFPSTMEVKIDPAWTTVTASFISFFLTGELSCSDNFQKTFCPIAVFHQKQAQS